MLQGMLRQPEDPAFIGAEKFCGDNEPLATNRRVKLIPFFGQA